MYCNLDQATVLCPRITLLFVYRADPEGLADIVVAFLYQSCTRKIITYLRLLGIRRYNYLCIIGPGLLWLLMTKNKAQVNRRFVS